ncbi:hypothetical protein AD945_10850 [Gluconobacter albidus]|uniref:Uncharacterized protein n=1 Tax=Gluconobacter albidus TaxID=318683 RepID=A0A149TH24_9PROT|nr:hypothetical protein [Gluconobacter albidus]KXV47098.1 hypothetical protein AD945_10850 [Gluconobacter albidus]
MIRTGEQFDLLAWAPPETVAAFDPQLIRANSYGGRLSRAISVSLDGCGYSRAEIAARMSEQLGRKISLNILNAYASVARETHEISVSRFDALVGATGDRRLLEFVAADHGFSVIDRRYLPMIELAAVGEHKRELARKERAIRGAVRGGRW